MMCLRVTLRLFLVALICCLPSVLAAQSEYAITHVTVIDPATGTRSPNRTVVIKDATIVSVGSLEQQHLPSTVKVIDGGGKFLIPGLWDMHVHFRDTERDLKMDLANGVLGIRNMGGVPDEVFSIRDAINGGKTIGPKIVACGPIIDGPNSWSNPKFTISVNSADEARKIVQSLHDRGADCIKVYDGLQRDSYLAIMGESRTLGMPVVGHLPAPISVREASDAGQRSLEHGMFLAGGCSDEKSYVARRMDQTVFQRAMQTKDFRLIPEKIGDDETFMLDHFRQSQADATYRVLAKNGTFITPTLVTQRALTFIDDLDRKPDPRKTYVSAEELNWWKPENGLLTKYRTPEYIAMRKREFALTLKEVNRAQRLGVRLLAGTDITIPYTYPGFSLHDELKLFVHAGLNPLQALRTATTNPALFLGISNRWGRIKIGYSANLVLLTADPLSDINNVDRVDSIVLNGRFIDRAALDRMLQEAKVPGADDK